MSFASQRTSVSLEWNGGDVKEGPLNAEQERLKHEFVANRGYWNPVWEQLLQQAPEFFDAYSRLSSVPWQLRFWPP